MAQETVAADPLVDRRGLPRTDAGDALVETGALDGEPVELLEGTLVTVSSMPNPGRPATPASPASRGRRL